MSSEARKKIAELYKANPVPQTLQQLAKDYCLDIPRVSGIVRLEEIKTEAITKARFQSCTKLMVLLTCYSGEKALVRVCAEDGRKDARVRSGFRDSSHCRRSEHEDLPCWIYL